MAAVEQQISSIVIVGGGTAGWMTAAALCQHFLDTPVQITLVESSQLGTIGVGEATIPTLRRFYNKLGFSDIDVIRATNATCKLGIEFQDWHSPGSSFIHPFGLFGLPVKDTPFHHYWLKAQQTGNASDLADYSLGVNLAKQDKFCFPSPKPESALQIFDWALHFDAALFADLMRTHAIKNNITAIDGKIAEVVLDSQNGDIKTLQLEDGRQINGDLFIDCSGFAGLLIEKALHCGFEDWSQWLLCDKAFAVQTESVGAPIPRTIAKAHQAGWQWKIPLQHRSGNGHVYSSQYISDDDALQTLIENLDGKALHSPRQFSFKPGRRKNAWHKNCIAVGLAAGFLEPLESTSIALVETAIDKIIQSFPKAAFSQTEVDKFNQVTATEYERVRDFIILHYKANQRDDSPMWRYCREMSVPDSLNEKMQAFKSVGDLSRSPWEIFGPDSWLAIYSGFNYLPDTYAAEVDNMPTEYLNTNLAKMRSAIKNMVTPVPSHLEFLSRFCAYKANTQ
ncbi:tryptophan halogenase family protein [Paraglaciecola arctica]|uniref:Tryptophan halogenase n=1 Tax=Paraglaciecola arctica BSs20135 TaxID=493475 RepID=K6Z687_9ALTE|nr:tryptophan halogenase family protein [Paraglaciecola arctica]GAC18945.1 tryptophan halogenase [Paraglaciecola arctica BSs20135]